MDAVTGPQLRRHLAYHKISAPRFAILEADDGGYLQLYGGGATCCLEWRNMDSRKHYRAYLEAPAVPWHEPATIGDVQLQPQECLPVALVIECFLAFLESGHQARWPEAVRWRDITDELSAHGVSPP